MTLPTQNPIPSSAKNDQLFNAEKIDQVVNSDDLEYSDRFGKKRFTFSGLYNIIQSWISSLSSASGASTVGLNQGGTVQQALNYLTPEMFEDRVVDDDWTPAIRAAMSAAIASGINQVIGDGIYTVSTPLTIRTGSKKSPNGTTLSVRQGFRLNLNVVIVNADKWPAVPSPNFWDATAFIYPSTGVEHFKLRVDEFDGGGVASFFDAKGGSFNTSHIHVGNMRNHIIGYRDYLTMASQSGMNNITGHLWQGGYHAVLIGGTGDGGGNSECHNINITWCATHRYGAISLQDRSQYATITGGTYDYNGNWTAMLTLDSATSTANYDVEYGDILTIGDKTAIALSSIMRGNLEYTLLVSESADKKDGTSDYAVGDVVSFGSWSATIKAIKNTSATSVRYHDVIVSNRTGDFSKHFMIPNYIGGAYGHNMFTGFTWQGNSVAVASAINIRGLGIAGDVNNMYWYAQHLYGNSPFLTLNADGCRLSQTFILGGQVIKGNTWAGTMAVGVPTTVMTFTPATSNLTRKKFRVEVTSSVTAQCGSFEVYVGTAALTTLNSTLSNVTIAADGLNLILTLTGSAATLQINAIRLM